MATSERKEQDCYGRQQVFPCNRQQCRRVWPCAYQTHRDASLDEAHPVPYLVELLAVPPGPVADVDAAPVLTEDPIVKLAPVVAHDAVMVSFKSNSN